MSIRLWNRGAAALLGLMAVVGLPMTHDPRAVRRFGTAIRRAQHKRNRAQRRQVKHRRQFLPCMRRPRLKFRYSRPSKQVHAARRFAEIRRVSEADAMIARKKDARFAKAG